MKLLVDNQLPKALAFWFVDHGHDAVHVLDRGQGQTDDREIWNTALEEERIVVSKDEDFFILATRPTDTGRLLWLRIGNCRTHALLMKLGQLLPAIEESFEAGQRIVEVR